MIAIPNMEKPKHCTECYFVCRDQCELQDNSYDYDTFKEQRKHCPLIEIDQEDEEAVLFLARMRKAMREGKSLREFLDGERRSDESDRKTLL